MPPLDAFTPAPTTLTHSPAHRIERCAQELRRLSGTESFPSFEGAAWARAFLGESPSQQGCGKLTKQLTLFLRQPDAPLTNNAGERLLKGAIRCRKNAYFYKSPRGAEVGDTYMALAYTAELNGKNPVDYLTALLEHPDAVAAEPEAWLPWTYEATRALRASAAATTSERATAAAGM